MIKFNSPAKLFAGAALLLFVVRLLFPPADFPGALQAHSYLKFLDFRLDLTGYGLFEFAGIVFLMSAVAYALVKRLTNRAPNNALVQIHFWPSLLFAVFSIFFAHWVNHIPAAQLGELALQVRLKNWSTAFNWSFLLFLVLQLIFAIGAVRRIWLSRYVMTGPKQ